MLPVWAGRHVDCSPCCCRSDVAGQVLPLLGMDWTQNGVVSLKNMHVEPQQNISIPLLGAHSIALGGGGGGGGGIHISLPGVPFHCWGRGGGGIFNCSVVSVVLQPLSPTSPVASWCPQPF